MIIAVIPSRFPSVRLPGKPLIDLCGQTMVERVWRAAKQCAVIDRVVIATDDQRVIDEANRIGAESCMTSPDLPSGTDRCYEVVRQLNIEPDIVINIQGDEPLLHPSILEDLIADLHKSGADVSTPITKIYDQAEIHDPMVVKVALGKGNRAMYFSRAPIPFIRDAGDSGDIQHWKHLGIYAYRLPALRKHVALSISSIEYAEKLEQLRLLADGTHFVCTETMHKLLSVDTPEDAERVRAVLRSTGR